MEETINRLLDNPFAIAVLVFILVGALALKVLVDPKRAEKKQNEAIDSLLVQGKYDQAASLALSLDRLDEALEYYLRAQQPARAAQLAARLGKTRQAAELYERAGDPARAAHLYDQAGVPDKAEELRRLVPATAKTRRGEPTAGSASHALAYVPTGELRAPTAGAGPASDDLDAAKAMRPSIDDRRRRHDEARARADQLLASGDLQGAADALRDGGLDEEAIHLYTNVLGQPAQAAPILCKRGEHQRAAELYELGGERRAAATEWAHLAEQRGQVADYVDRIEALASDVALDLLERETAKAPLDTSTANLHYAMATLLERMGEVARALQTLVDIQSRVGPFRDVGPRITRLEAAPSAGPRPTPVSGSGSVLDADRPMDPAPVGLASRASSPGGLKLSANELSSLAREVALAAAEQLRNSNVLTALRLQSLPVSAVRAPVSVHVVGLEAQPLALDLACDEAVRWARSGPSADSLRRFIGDSSCDLGNIEVFYRLGLAQLARGQWEDAAASFDHVEEASPGYRDAGQRAHQVRAWQHALGSRRTELGAPRSRANEADRRYAIKGELGRGGMAVVYRASDARLGRDVALKFMSEEMSGDAAMKELFEREARSVAQLNHPNIITVYEFGELEGRLFISMEYLEGKPIDQKLDKESKLPVVEALRIGRQMLEALDYAHGKSIIHRDIKPSNTFLTTAGVVKLMDFGLAKSIESGTKSSLVAGTPEYMAPEQIVGGSVDQRSDLFSVGCALYEMMTGMLPFAGMDRSSAPAAPSTIAPGVPEVVDKIVLTAVALDPRDRFQAATNFLQPVRDVLEQFGHATPRPAPVRHPSRVAPLKRPIIPRTDD